LRNKRIKRFNRVRLGLNRVKGIGLKTAARIAEAREIAPFENPDDLANRASLNTAEVHALANADALRTLSGHRRQALWTVTSHITQRDLMRDAPAKETLPVIPTAPEGEEIIADYASIRLTLRRRPLALLLGKQGFSLGLNQASIL
jgi:error-prone DNA polymerase